jgi:sulfatase maturation enzyme AslB (radical SAM superfamily)
MANECLSLILTAQCNLRCSYCYQNAKTARRAEWSAVQAGIDLAFGEGSSHVELLFLGGEPLLEFNLLRRAVSHAEALDPCSKHFRFALSTNGTLISEAVADYLDEHQFEVRLSLDGIEQAQAYRGRGTFEILNSALDSLRAKHPQLFGNRLRISLTVMPATISFLADSVKYLLEKDVREIRIAPCLTPCPGWHSDRINELDAEFASLVEISRIHAERTGTIPMKIFRKATNEVPQKNRRFSTCDALTGRTLTIDVDGQLYTCPLLAESYQNFPPGSLMEQASMLKLGDVRDPEVRRRRAALSESARISDLWTPREGCSSYGNCSECEYYGRCTICPVSVWQASSAAGPRRIPDFICAFNKAALKYSDRFPCVTDALKKFLPERDAPDPIRRLEEYLRARQGR